MQFVLATKSCPLRSGSNAALDQDLERLCEANTMQRHNKFNNSWLYSKAATGLSISSDKKRVQGRLTFREDTSQ